MDSRGKLLAIVAVGEGATGLALLVVPSLLAELLLGEALAGVAVTLARIAGIALVALAVACWPGAPRAAMLAYSAAVALYLAGLAVSGAATGILVWPVVVLHALVAVLLARDILRHRRD